MNFDIVYITRSQIVCEELCGEEMVTPDLYRRRHRRYLYSVSMRKKESRMRDLAHFITGIVWARVRPIRGQ